MIDRYLENLVTLAEHLYKGGKEHEIEVTLFLSGVVVAGRMISEDEYFQRSGEHATLFHAMEVGEDVARLKLGKARRDLSAVSGFIHLDVTGIFAGENQPLVYQDDLLWRGKLSSVDAFTLGSVAIL